MAMIQAMAAETQVDATLVYNLRRTGATLQEIGDRLGRSKERIRQILVKNYGTTDCRLLSTEQIAEKTGLSRYQIMKLYQAGVITPERGWKTGCGRYLLWSAPTIGKLKVYEREKRLCRICGGPIPRGRSVCCSQECLEESRKYKYKSEDAKRAYLRSISDYRRRRRQMAMAAV